MIDFSKSRIGMGTGLLGNLYQELSNSEAEATLKRAWDEGIRYFDTAPYYGMGLSERRLGDALRAKPREAYILSTKVGRLLRPANAVSRRCGFESPLPFESVFDYSYDGVWRSFEDSLQRLGLATIDILYMHDIGRKTHGRCHGEKMKQATGGLRAMREIKAQGLVSAIGIGVNEIDVCFEVMELSDIDVILLAGRYNLLERHDAAKLFHTCSERDVSVVAAGIYASGILATGVSEPGPRYFDYEPASNEIVEQVRRLEETCRRHEVLLPAAAVQFVLRNPRVQSVLLGMCSTDQVTMNMSFASMSTPEGLWEELDVLDSARTSS